MTNGWEHDDAGHVIGGQFGGPGALASGNIFPQDSGENQRMGWQWEQGVGYLAQKNVTQADFHMCVLEVFDYLDLSGSFDIRPTDEEYLLRLEGTPRERPATMPASFVVVPNPNNNVGNPTNTAR